MQVIITNRPSGAMAAVTLVGHEAVVAQAGAMIAMSTDTQVTSRALGGVGASIQRAFLQKRTFWLTHFQAPAEGGEVFLTPHCQAISVLCRSAKATHG